nr:ORF1 [Torque teno midi virus]
MLYTAPTKYNKETKNQLWMSAIGDIHDGFCGCDIPFAHLLDNIFPEGHTDRDKTIAEIIERDKKCLFGGEEEKETGMPAGTDIGEKGGLSREEEEEEDLADEDILQGLIDAGEDAPTR